MKFLIDAQLPPSLKHLFLVNGYDCIHTFDLELGNNIPDSIINKVSIEEKRIFGNLGTLETFKHFFKYKIYQTLLIFYGSIYNSRF